MIDGFREMYRILDKYAENEIDEREHAFISALKWPDSYRLQLRTEVFWEEIHRKYDISITKGEQKEIVTVGDLKKKIEECLMYN